MVLEGSGILAQASHDDFARRLAPRGGGPHRRATQDRRLPPHHRIFRARVEHDVGDPSNDIARLVVLRFAVTPSSRAPSAPSLRSMRTLSRAMSSSRCRCQSPRPDIAASISASADAWAFASSAAASVDSRRTVDKCEPPVCIIVPQTAPASVNSPVCLSHRGQNYQFPGSAIY